MSAPASTAKQRQHRWTARSAPPPPPTPTSLTTASPAIYLLRRKSTAKSCSSSNGHMNRRSATQEGHAPSQ
eukprot:12969238-Heterocapsa_arctica.AAC.1